MYEKKVIVLCCLVFLYAGCGQIKTNQEYDRITKSGISGQELLRGLTDFELRNPMHFTSKVDLGGYYILTGNYTEAWNYLKRAESVISSAPKDDNGKKNICVMYGTLARLAFLKADYETSSSYAQKAVSCNKKYGAPYRYFQAQILLAQDKKQESLLLYDKLYTQQPENITAKDLQAYMYLLADGKRFEECKAILEQYFEKGSFFSGLGMFASSVYEETGDIEKSIFSAFLDYELYSSYNKSEDALFAENLQKLEDRLKTGNNYESALPAITLLRSLFDISVSPPERHIDFFAADYCSIKRKILTSAVTIADFNKLLQLEPRFSNFPAYYWTIWNAVCVLSPEVTKDYMPVLKKIITLADTGPYALKARRAICEISGIDVNQADKLDSILF